MLDPSFPVEINGEGQLIQNDRIVAQLKLGQPADPTMLEKVGNNLMRLADSSPGALIGASGRVLQHHVEASSTDPIMTLTDMINATKAVQSNTKMMQYHDHVMTWHRSRFKPPPPGSAP